MKQEIATAAMSIVRQIKQLELDGYTDVSLKNGKETNPATGALEECVVLDMTLSPAIPATETKKQHITLFFHG